MPLTVGAQQFRNLKLREFTWNIQGFLVQVFCPEWTLLLFHFRLVYREMHYICLMIYHSAKVLLINKYSADVQFTFADYVQSTALAATSRNCGLIP